MAILILEPKKDEGKKIAKKKKEEEITREKKKRKKQKKLLNTVFRKTFELTSKSTKKQRCVALYQDRLTKSWCVYVAPQPE